MKTIAAFTLVLAASPAFALNQSKHYDVSNASCLSAGMPPAFCARVAAETYDVDSNEFNDLSAHSQMPDGVAACDAANASMARVLGLGIELRGHVQGVAWNPTRDETGALAKSLGRALHTLQDNCAHAGMGNPQHAWHSLSDVCRGTSESPDVQPEAATCAAAETDAIISTVVDLLHDSGGDFSNLANVDDEERHYPAYGDVCNFLGGASTWDGSDRRWDNSIVSPALRAQLIEAITSDSPQSHDVCANTDSGILVSWADDVDVSQGPPSCIQIHAFCLGKADSLEAEEPPYEKLEPHATGCSFIGGGDARATAPALLLFACVPLLAIGLRRRGRID